MPASPKDRAPAVKGPRRSLQLLWGTHEKAGRGPKPALSLEGIVQAAIEIATNEGIAELSMRRVADRLGSKPMSLYRYVQSKDELIDVMLDTLVGPPPILDAVTGGWRAKLEYWARREWEIFQRYPWAPPLVPSHFLMGPNRIGWVEAALRALRDSGLPINDVFDSVNMVDRYIRGTALELASRASNSGIPVGEWWPAHSPFLRDPKYAAIVEVFESPRSSPRNDVDFGLQRILDGIEALIASRTAKKRPKK